MRRQGVAMGPHSPSRILQRAVDQLIESRWDAAYRSQVA
jgi:hypothetical protein